MTSEAADSGKARSVGNQDTGTPIVLYLIAALLFTIGTFAGYVLSIPALRTSATLSMPIVAGFFGWRSFQWIGLVYLLFVWRSGRSQANKYRSLKNFGRALRIAFARRRFLASYVTLVLVTGLMLLAFANISLMLAATAILALIVLLPFAFRLGTSNGPPRCWAPPSSPALPAVRFCRCHPTRRAVATKPVLSPHLEKRSLVTGFWNSTISILSVSRIKAICVSFESARSPTRRSTGQSA